MESHYTPSKQVLNFLSAIKSNKDFTIFKWIDLESICYLKKFFMRETITHDSVTKTNFLIDSAGPLFHAISQCMVDGMPDKMIQSLAYTRFNSYAEAILVNPKEKLAKPTSPADIAAMDHGISSMVFWKDSFPMMRQRILFALDWILKNAVNYDYIENDIVRSKFEKAANFFSLNNDEKELMKFCFVFRATNLKLPRNVQIYSDRMKQLSEMTGVDQKVIESYASEKYAKKFLPFIIAAVNIPNQVWEYLADDSMTDLTSMFYTMVDASKSLPISFFTNLKEDESDRILKIINGDAKIDRPRHILLYGKPGTGKTSYAVALCKLSGRHGFFISQSTKSVEDNGEHSETAASVETRFTSIKVCDEHINNQKSIIIVDESDELINCYINSFGGGGFYSTRTKSFLNQIMDSTKTPVIWITNNASYMIDPSCRRRFDYSIFFDDFDNKQRETIWRNCIKKYNLSKKIPSSLVKEFSEKYNITPGGVSTACQNLIDINPSADETRSTLEAIIKKHCELLEIRTTDKVNEKFMPCDEYSLDGLNIESSIPINEVVDMCRIYLKKKEAGTTKRAMNILFSGPSGTGKTECVKFIGHELNRQVRVLHASSILDKYVGETEKKIAEEFAKAEKDGAILFMDEIDGLLGGREKAHQTWEVSQVNEILCQMENFKGIFIGASNFEENLDAASIRRFTFKFKFKALTGDGIISFFNRYFYQIKKTDKFYSELRQLRNVTPGDFALVKMLSEFTKDKINSEWVYNALKRELTAKKKNSGLNNSMPTDIGY